MVNWHSVLDRDSSPANDRQSVAAGALEAALHVSRAPMGNVQLLDAQGVLRIVAHHGFCPPFLEFFRCVRSGEAACGAAERAGAPVIVEDVGSSPIFADTPALEVMKTAGALAVASFPIVGRLGRIVGVVSVHHDQPHRPSMRTLAMIESIAARAGKLL